MVTFQGLKTRKTYGRILGIDLLLTLMVVSITDGPYVQRLYGAIADGQPLPTPPYECWKQSDIQTSRNPVGMKPMVSYGYGLH